MTDRGDGPEAEAEKEQEWLGNADGPDLRAAEEVMPIGGFHGVYGGSMGAGAHTGLPPTPEQLRDDEAEEQDYVAEHEAKVSARYDELTPAQREKEYVHPNLWRRFTQIWTGV